MDYYKLLTDKLISRMITATITEVLEPEGLRNNIIEIFESLTLKYNN